jgi:hypothetical protein
VGLPFWVFVITYMKYMCCGSTNFGGSLDISIGPPDMEGFYQIWWTCHFYFWNLFLRPSLGIFPLPRGSQPLGHVNHLYSHVPCQRMVFHLIFHIIMPCQLPHHCMVYHMDVGTATWFFFIGPRIDPKNPKTSDGWQPMVFPCQHANVMPMSS